MELVVNSFSGWYNPTIFDLVSFIARWRLILWSDGALCHGMLFLFFFAFPLVVHDVLFSFVRKGLFEAFPLSTGTVAPTASHNSLTYLVNQVYSTLLHVDSHIDL